MTYEEARAIFNYREGRLYWRVQPYGSAQKGAPAGCVNNRGYVTIGWRRRRYSAHRLVFLWHYGWLPAEVDHINNDHSDNRVENLRPATRSENQRNIGILSSNKSGVKGVCWHKSSRKWRADCRVNGTLNYLGLFSTIEAAAKAVQQFRAQHHGEFANHGG